MSAGTANRLRALGYDRHNANRRVILADGSITPIAGVVTVPLTILGREITHELQIMPSLGVEILVGVDLWARTRYSIPPPPIRSDPALTLAAAASETSPDDEGTRLREFLATEMRLFEGVHGSTDRIQHVIRVKATDHETPRCKASSTRRSRRWKPRG